jgi:hypothetical protein
MMHGQKNIKSATKVIVYGPKDRVFFATEEGILSSLSPPERFQVHTFSCLTRLVARIL